MAAELVRDAKDKTSTYRNQIEPIKIARARKASRKFYLYFRKVEVQKRLWDSTRQDTDSLTV